VHLSPLSRNIDLYCKLLKKGYFKLETIPNLYCNDLIDGLIQIPENVIMSNEFIIAFEETYPLSSLSKESLPKSITDNFNHTSICMYVHDILKSKRLNNNAINKKIVSSFF
jgi:hypothetical protein